MSWSALLCFTRNGQHQANIVLRSYNNILLYIYTHPRYDSAVEGGRSPGICSQTLGTTKAYFSELSTAASNNLLCQLFSGFKYRWHFISHIRASSPSTGTHFSRKWPTSNGSTHFYSQERRPYVQGCLENLGGPGQNQRLGPPLYTLGWLIPTHFEGVCSPRKLSF